MDKINEAHELVLKYKGEYYEDVVRGLETSGFVLLSQDTWKSINTNGVYKFVLSGYGRDTYVTRIEELFDFEFHPIDVGLSNKKEAIERYAKEHKSEQTIQREIKNAVLHDFTANVPIFEFIHSINKKKNKDSVSALLQLIGSNEITIDSFLNVLHPSYGNKIACAVTWRCSNEVIKEVVINERTYYIVPVEKSYKGYLDSILSKFRLIKLLGESKLHKIENEAEQ